MTDNYKINIPINECIMAINEVSQFIGVLNQRTLAYGTSFGLRVKWELTAYNKLQSFLRSGGAF